MLDDDDEVVVALEPVGRGLQLVGVGHQLEHQAALLQRRGARRRPGAGPSEAPIGRTPRNRGAPICRSSELDRLGHRVGRRQAADDGGRGPSAVGSLVELERLVDECRPVAAATFTSFSTFQPSASAR